MIKYNITKERMLLGNTHNGRYYLSNGHWCFNAGLFKHFPDSGVMDKIFKKAPFCLQFSQIEDHAQDLSSIMPADLTGYEEVKFTGVNFPRGKESDSFYQAKTFYTAINTKYALMLEDISYTKLVAKDAMSAVIVLDKDNEILGMIMPMRFDLPDCIKPLEVSSND